MQRIESSFNLSYIYVYIKSIIREKTTTRITIKVHKFYHNKICDKVIRWLF